MPHAEFDPETSRTDLRRRNVSGSQADCGDDHGSHRSSARPQAEPSLDSVRVLVIEDNALVRDAMHSLLTAWGIRVTLAEGALMACDQVRQAQVPDLILSDFRLNDGYDGINAIRLVRDIVGSEIPACLISADADGNLACQAQAAGLYFLQKPVPPAKLRSILRGVHPSRLGSATG